MRIQFIALACSMMMAIDAIPVALTRDWFTMNDDGLYKYPHYDTIKCDDKHTPDLGLCPKLLDKLRNSDEKLPAKPRSYCEFGCCLSWSEKIDKTWQEMIPHFERIDVVCAKYGKSGQQKNGKFNLCMSDRPKGCYKPALKRSELVFGAQPDSEQTKASSPFLKRHDGVMGNCQVARDNKHGFSRYACEKLIELYKDSEEFLPREPREDCVDKCCVSWSAEVYKVTKKEVYPYIKEIFDESSDGESGRVVCEQDYFSICLSDRGKGCKNNQPKGGEVIAEGIRKGGFLFLNSMVCLLL